MTLRSYSRSTPTPKNICLITPMHPSSNPRLVKEADALVEAGYTVEVIAPDYSPQWRAADEEFRDRSWKIIARPRFGPASPKVTRLWELTRRFTATAAARNLGLMHPIIVRAAWHPVVPALVRHAKNTNADLYVAHLVAALPAAALAARKHGVVYGFDAEDFHLGDVPTTPEFALERRLTREIEGAHLPGCAYVTAASPLIATAYAETYNIPEPAIVPNVFPLTGAVSAPSAAGTATPGPSIYWFSQTIGPDRGLECAVRAISIAQAKPHLYLRGSPANGYLTYLRQLASTAGVGDRVHILPVAQPSEMERLAAIYDIGLCGETGETRNRQLSLGNKIFSYLLAGLPVAMSSTPAHIALAPELGCAARLYTIDDAQSLAAAFDLWMRDQGTLATARRAAWELGQRKFNWDIYKPRYLGTISQALETSPAEIAACEARGSST